MRHPLIGKLLLLSDTIFAHAPGGPFVDFTRRARQWGLGPPSKENWQRKSMKRFS